MTPSLVFDGVWKRFRRGQIHDSLRDLVPAMFRRIVGRGPGDHVESRYFWALRDLSFEVMPGEVLGIIGGNGAGKSTTLKLLTKILEPTAGLVRTNGKIGALIEVSGGFHQDLTGRQNVFLQGAIMGMRKAEIQRKFDEIVEFSGIGDFIDTPVKRYSSGMNARLGFSIAAHLEPDILIIDEVLAVGDAEFQAKAFGRVQGMAKGGAPVVLVSHQLDRIAELCTKAILLEKGAVRTSGTAKHCIDEYLHGLNLNRREALVTDARIQFHGIVARDGLAVFSGEQMTVVVHGTADVNDPPRAWTPAFRIVDPKTGHDVHSVTGFQRGIPLPVRGEFEYELTLQMNVPPGVYDAQAFIWDSETNRHVTSSERLEIEVFEKMQFYGGTQMNTKWSAAKLASPVAAVPPSKHTNGRRSA